MSPDISTSAYVAPTATVRGRVKIGPRSIVMFGAVLRAEDDEVVIGRETNVQDNAVVHCDAGFPTIVGDRVTIGHGAVVHGSTIGDSCLVGAGAIALNGSVLEEGAWLGAGSLLGEGQMVPARILAVGVPARPLRELRPDEIARQRDGVDAYLRLGDQYRAEAPSGD